MTVERASKLPIESIEPAKDKDDAAGIQQQDITTREVMPSRTAVFTVLIICIGCIISWIALSALSSQSYTASSGDDGGAAIDASAHIPLLSPYDNADLLKIANIY